MDFLLYNQARYGGGRMRGGLLAVLFPSCLLGETWSGCCLHITSENVFLWADRTQVNYTNWNNNTPDSEDEKCGELFPANMKWDDVKCDERKGYICSARKIPSNSEKMDADCITSLQFKIVIGVFAGFLLMVILVSVVSCFRAWKRESQNKVTVTAASRQSVTPILQEMYDIDQV